ncbi:MAG: hypothetical protein ABI378_02955 [Chitinophagaceae bacterium]
MQTILPISGFIKAQGRIKAFFKATQQKVFSLEDLLLILQDYGPYWQLSASITIEVFAEQLTNSGILSANKFRFRKWVPDRIRFWTKKADIYDVALSLLPQAYLSHASALFLHGIKDKSPNTIFISSEQSPKNQSISTRELEQEHVDIAFGKQQRQSNATCEYQGKEITALNGMFTNRAGIIKLGGKTVTSIERTLIDITVRPSYVGGVQEVFRAYVALREKLEVSALITMLDDIGYIYPYFQSVGFYLEMAGYNMSEVRKLKQREKFIDLYLAYAMEETEYSPEWRLHYPKDYLPKSI